MTETASEDIREKNAATLSAALVQAQQAVRALEKDGTNQFHKYSYTTAESMIDEGRQVLNGAGLSLQFIGTNVFGVEADYQGGKRTQLFARFTFRLTHESSGHKDGAVWQVEWPVCEEKGRPLDKALGGAQTTCLAYTIRNLLLIPRDDDKAAMDRRDDVPDDAPRTTAGGAEKMAGPSTFVVKVQEAAKGEPFSLEGLTSIEVAGVNAVADLRKLYDAGDTPGLAKRVAQARKEIKGPVCDVVAKVGEKMYTTLTEKTETEAK